MMEINEAGSQRNNSISGKTTGSTEAGGGSSISWESRKELCFDTIRQLFN
jgi:hypothetical protein